MNRAAQTAIPLLLSAFMASTASAGDGIDGYEFPECTDERGEKVAFVEDVKGSGTIVLRFNVRYLDAENLEQPTVLFHRGFVESIPDLLRNFFVAHECYHFSSGDARYAINVKPEKRGIPAELHKLIEDNANCAAAHAMREEYGYSPDYLDQLESQIGEYTSLRQAREDMPVIRACYRQEQPMPVPVRQTMEHQ